MTNSVRTVVADLDFDTRHRILGAFSPVHPNVYAHHVTAAYRDVNVRVVGMKEAIVTGQVMNDRVQVLLLRVDGDDYRPDGKLWHLTISTADDVPPKEGGDVTFDQAMETGELRFRCLFRTRNAQRDEPDREYIPKEVLYAN
jgi:hypothetical protein